MLGNKLKEYRYTNTGSYRNVSATNTQGGAEAWVLGNYGAAFLLLNKEQRILPI
jgi:hypothetical protein